MPKNRRAPEPDLATPGDVQAPRTGIPNSVLTACVILALVIAYFAFGTLRSSARDEAPLETAETEGDRPLFTVLAAEIAPSPQLETISMRGRTEAVHRVVVRAETSGQVARVLVEDGADVASGDVLCRLETDGRDALVAEATAALRKAEADEAATRRLVAEGFSSEAQQRTAEAALDAARARLAQASLERQNVDMKAPFDGVVAEVIVEAGDVVAPGGACAVVADLDQIVIVGSVTAEEATRLQHGALAQVRVGNIDPFDATVRFVADVADRQTRAYRVELLAANTASLADGQNATAVIDTGTSTATLIPRHALVTRDDGQLGVRILTEPRADKTATVAFAPVRIVGEAPDGVYLSGPGLDTTAWVITRGQDYVAAGRRVAFVEDGA